SRGVAK
ncbi:hypothetical protein BN1723_019380, partial [Verticillium longisporum]